MNNTTTYYEQVKLLVQLLPFVAKEKCFALKGGTAINLFIRDLPRLSVDIDLVYLPIDSRNESRTNAVSALKRITDDIIKAFPNYTVQFPKEDTDSIRTIVSQRNISVKIELSPVMRGSIFLPRILEVREIVEDNFGYAEMQVMDFSDVYAGKICAALSRQHPRDLFDIKLLLEKEGIDNRLRKAFIVYLISHNRPISDLLDPNPKEINDIFISEFMYMSDVQVTVKDLETAREQLVRIINSTLTEEEKEFLLSFKSLSPDWSLLGLDGVADLPAVKWKIINLQRMPKEKHEIAVKKLRAVLFG